MTRGSMAAASKVTLVSLRSTTAILAGLLLLAPMAARADDLIWQPSATADNGPWNQSAVRWSNGAPVAFTNGDNVTFNDGVFGDGYRVTIDEGAPLQVGSITFATDGVNIRGSGANTLDLAGPISVTGADDVGRISASIASGNIVKQGAGRLVLNGDHDTTGTVTVQAGALRIADAASLTADGQTTIENGAILDGFGTFTGDIVNEGTLSGVLTINGAVDSTDAGSTFSMSGGSISGLAELGGTSTALGVAFNGGLENTGALDIQVNTTGGGTFLNAGSITNTLGQNLSISGFTTFTNTGTIATQSGGGAGSLTIAATTINLNDAPDLAAADGSLNLTGAVNINGAFAYINKGTITGTVTVADTASFTNGDGETVSGLVTSLGTTVLTGGSLGALAVEDGVTTISGGSVTGDVDVGVAGVTNDTSLIIDADATLGSLTVGGGDAVATAQISGATATVTGAVTVQGTSLAAGGTLTVDSDATLDAAAVTIDNFGTLTTSGTIDGNISLTAGNAVLNAQAGTIMGTVNNAGGLINANGGSFGDTVINSGQTDVTAFTAGTTFQNAGGVLNIADNITLDANITQSGAATLNNDGTIDGNVGLFSGTMNLNGNVTGTISLTGLSTTLNTGMDLDGITPSVVSGGVTNSQATINAADTTFTSGITNNANGAVNVIGAVTGNIQNDSGTVDVAALQTLTGNLSTSGGTSTVVGIVTGTGDISNGTLTNTGQITGAVTNTGGTINADGGVFGTGEIVNTSGTLNINATYGLDVQANGGAVNVATGVVLTGDLTQAGATTTNRGTIVDDIDVAGGSLVNRGIITGNVTVTAGGSLAAGVLGGGASSISGTVVNNGGSVAANGGSFTSLAIQNNSGDLTVAGDTTATITLVDGDLTMNAVDLTGSVDVQGGIAISEANISGALDVSGGRFTGNGGQVSGAVTVSGGSLQTNGMTFAPATVIDNQSGTTRILGATAVDITNASAASEIRIDAGQILTGDIINTNGTTLAFGTLDGNLVLTDGIVRLGDGAGGEGVLTGTVLATGGTFNMTDANVQGAVSNNGAEFNVTSSSIDATFTNGAGGEFDARGDVAVADLVNDGGTIIVRSGANLTADIDNQSGNITVVETLTGSIDMIAGQLTNRGLITGQVTVDGTAIAIARAGSAFTAGPIDLAGGEFRVQESTSADVDVNGGTLTVSSGATMTGGVAMTSGAAENAGRITGSVGIAGGTFVQGTGGQTVGLTTVTNGNLTADGGNFAGGILMQSTGTLTLGADTTANIENDGATIVLASGATVAGDITHTSGATTLRSGVNGAVDIAGGTFFFGNSAAVSGLVTQEAGAVTIAGGALNGGYDINDGTLDVTGSASASRVQVLGGSAIIRAAATLTGPLVVNGATVSQRGTVTGNVSVTDGSVNNLGTIGGRLVLNTDAVVTHATGASVAGQARVNGGTLNAEGGSFGQQLRINGGTVNVTANTTASRNVRIISGDLNLDSSVTLTGNVLVESAGTFMLDGILSGNLNNQGTTDLDTTTGVIGGAFSNTGTLLLDGLPAGRLAAGPTSTNALTLTGSTGVIGGLIENLAGGTLEIAGGNLRGGSIENGGEILISNDKVLLSDSTIMLFSGSTTQIKSGGMEGEMTAEAGSSISLQSGDLEGALALSGALVARGSSQMFGDIDIRDAGELTVRTGLFDVNGALSAGTEAQVNIAGGATLRTDGFTNEGVVDMQNGATIAGNLRNTGVVKGTGTITLANGVDNEGGTVDLTGNKATGDVVSIGGAGLNGGAYKLDIDLGDADGTGDKIVITSGAVTGTVELAFNVLDSGAQQGDGVLVLDVNGADVSALTLSASGLPNNDPLRVYALSQTGNGNVVVTDALNPGVGALAGSIVLTQSLIGSVVNRPSSPFVSGLAIEGEDPCGAGLWARATGGQANTSGTVTQDGVADVTSTLDATYYGVQLGGDWACFNGFYNGWDMAFGGIAGVNFGDTTQPVYALQLNLGDGETTQNADNVTSVTDVAFQQTYAGIYTTAVKGPIALDLQYRVEDTEYTANNTGQNGFAGLGLEDEKFSSKAQTLSGAVSYAIPYEQADLTFVPTAGFAYSKISTDEVSFANLGSVKVEDFDSQVGFVGATLSRTSFGEDGVSAINRFVTATVYNDFAPDPESTFTSADGSFVQTITTENLGTYGELSAGLNYVKILQPGEFGAVRQLNAAVRADVRYSDQLESWGLTAQARLQF